VKITTKDCKKAIAEIIKNNPNIILKHYVPFPVYTAQEIKNGEHIGFGPNGKETEEEECLRKIQESCDPKKWVRRKKILISKNTNLESLDYINDMYDDSLSEFPLGTIFREFRAIPFEEFLFALVFEHNDKIIKIVIDFSD
jgi:hypothetical protein